jgi:hypothetical protein
MPKSRTSILGNQSTLFAATGTHTGFGSTITTGSNVAVFSSYDPIADIA